MVHSVNTKPENFKLNNHSINVLKANYMSGIGTDTGNISVNKTDKTPYFMEFIKESHSKQKNAYISPMEERYKALQRFLTEGSHLIREGWLFQRKCPVS